MCNAHSCTSALGVNELTCLMDTHAKLVTCPLIALGEDVHEELCMRKAGPMKLATTLPYAPISCASTPFHECLNCASTYSTGIGC